MRLRSTRAFIRGGNKVSRNENRKKLHGFSYSKNMANFNETQWASNFEKKFNLGKLCCLFAKTGRRQPKMLIFAFEDQVIVQAILPTFFIELFFLF